MSSEVLAGDDSKTTINPNSPNSSNSNTVFALRSRGDVVVVEEEGVGGVGGLRSVLNTDAYATVQITVKGSALAIAIMADENALEKAEAFVAEHKLKTAKYLAPIEREILYAQLDSMKHLRDRLVYYIDTMQTVGGATAASSVDNVVDSSANKNSSAEEKDNDTRIEVESIDYDYLLREMNEETVELQARLEEVSKQAIEYKKHADLAEESAHYLGTQVLTMQKLFEQAEEKLQQYSDKIKDQDTYQTMLVKKLEALEKENRTLAIKNRRQSMSIVSDTQSVDGSIVPKIAPEVKALRAERADLTMQIQALKAENLGLKDEMVSIKKPAGRRQSISVNGVAPVGRRASISAGQGEGGGGGGQISLADAARLAMGVSFLNEGEEVIKTEQKLTLENKVQELEKQIQQIQEEKSHLDDNIFMMQNDHTIAMAKLKHDLELEMKIRARGGESERDAFSRGILAENAALKDERDHLTEEVAMLRFEVDNIKDKTTLAMKAFQEMIELDDNLRGETDKIIAKLEWMRKSECKEKDPDEFEVDVNTGDDFENMNEIEKLLFKFRNFLHKRNTLSKEDLRDDSDVINPMVEDRLLRGVYARYVADSKSQIMNLTRFCRFAREFEVIDPGNKNRHNTRPDSPYLVSGQVDMIFTNCCKYKDPTLIQEKSKAFCPVRLNPPTFQINTAQITVEQFKFAVHEICEKLYGKIVEIETGTVLQCLPNQLRSNVSRSLMDLFMNMNILPMAEKLDLLPWPLMFMDQGITALSSGDQTFDVLSHNFDNLYSWFGYYCFKEQVDVSEGLSILSISRFGHDFAIIPYLIKEYQMQNLFDEIIRWGNGQSSIEMLESMPDVYKQLSPNLLIVDSTKFESISKKVAKYTPTKSLKTTISETRKFSDERILFNGFALLFLTISVQVYFKEDSNVRLSKLFDWCFKSGGPSLILREKTEFNKRLAK